MRVLLQNIFTPEIPNRTKRADMLWQHMAQYAQRLSVDGVIVDHAFVKRSTNVVNNPYFRAINSLAIMERIIAAPTEGYDAVAICCFTDPALQEARGAVDIPVVAAGEAAMLVAQLVGRRFAIVTVGTTAIRTLEANLAYYGGRERAIANQPVRALPRWNYEDVIDCFDGVSDRLIADFEQVAKRCVDDGADTILAGCAFLGPALMSRGYHHVADTGVPVVDGTSAAVKLAASMASLKQLVGLEKSTATISPYRTPPRAEIERVWSAFDFHWMAAGSQAAAH